MTVKQLITNLLDCPMDAKVLVVIKNDDDYNYADNVIPVDYEDGTIGLLGTKEVEK